MAVGGHGPPSLSHGAPSPRPLQHRIQEFLRILLDGAARAPAAGCSPPEIGIHLFQRSDRGLETFGFLLTPGAGQGIEICGAGDRRRWWLIRQASQGQAIHADTRTLSRSLEGGKLVGPQPPHP